MPPQQPAIVIVGAGRIGLALATRSRATGFEVALVTRDLGDDHLQGPAGVPICLTVRNDDLDAVLARVPPHRRDDLVFLQNGMLRPWLAAHHLTAATRGLLFFAVAQRGDSPVSGGTSPLHGPHAAHVAAWLRALGLPAEPVDAATFGAIELEKLVWNCAFGLLCQAHGCDVGTVVTAHRDELRALVGEYLTVAQGDFGPPLSLDPLVERLCAYSLAIATYRGAVKEWRWRNGWFVQAASERGVATPVHLQLLAQMGQNLQ